MNFPSTIKYPSTFSKSPAAGYDGVFDWSWTDGCFGGGKITPMDFDGVVERKGNFILFETKNPDAQIPKGQLYTLRAAHSLGCFTIMIIYGKEIPERAEIWFPKSIKTETIIGVEAAKKRVSDWYKWANENPRQEIDIPSAVRLVELALCILNGNKRPTVGDEKSELWT